MSPGDAVRVLGRHGNTVGSGVVIGVTAKDRTHAGKAKGRRMVVVQGDDGSKRTYPEASLRNKS